jgi:ubiquinone/menaquinone biosynthesis C-methylase UbiE
MDLNKEIKAFWEGEAEIYSHGIQEELQGKQRQAWKKLILEYAPKKEVLKILDAGCGPGFFSVILGEEGHEVTGIDITENMIAEARENVRQQGQKAALFTMDCQELEFQDDTFDLVICRNITWTLDNPQKAYREWKRVLKPGGRMLVFDACWYLHQYDNVLGEKFKKIEEQVNHKYGKLETGHADPEKGDELGSHAFLSDKRRPLWDLEYLMSIGFKKVFAEPDIMEKVYWSEREKELHQLTPGFLVGAEK